MRTNTVYMSLQAPLCERACATCYHYPASDSMWAARQHIFRSASRQRPLVCKQPYGNACLLLINISLQVPACKVCVCYSPTRFCKCLDECSLDEWTLACKCLHVISVSHTHTLSLPKLFHIQPRSQHCLGQGEWGLLFVIAWLVLELWFISKMQWRMGLCLCTHTRISQDLTHKAKYHTMLCSCASLYQATRMHTNSQNERCSDFGVHSCFVASRHEHKLRTSAPWVTGRKYTKRLNHVFLMIKQLDVDRQILQTFCNDNELACSTHLVCYVWMWMGRFCKPFCNDNETSVFHSLGLLCLDVDGQILQTFCKEKKWWWNERVPLTWSVMFGCG